MQNIVEVITKGSRMAIVLRDVTANTYSAHAYRQQSNGEFQRLPGVLAKSYDARAALDAAKNYTIVGI
jgi:hypothetical protein